MVAGEPLKCVEPALPRLGLYSVDKSVSRDTNVVKITCTGGSRIEKDRYEVHHEVPGGLIDDTGKVLNGGTVTMKKSDGALTFVSNSPR